VTYEYDEEASNLIVDLDLHLVDHRNRDSREPPGVEVYLREIFFFQPGLENEIVRHS
jgi:hypothetical protein